jgi:hypothetical protein
MTLDDGTSDPLPCTGYCCTVGEHGAEAVTVLVTAYDRPP